MGQKQIVIPKKVINTLNEWNTSDIFADELEYDQRLINVLLLVCVSAENLVNRIVDNDVKDLLRGMYEKC